MPWLPLIWSERRINGELTSKLTYYRQIGLEKNLWKKFLSSVVLVFEHVRRPAKSQAALNANSQFRKLSQMRHDDIS
jgi:hypothetical protein